MRKKYSCASYHWMWSRYPVEWRVTTKIEPLSVSFLSLSMMYISLLQSCYKSFHWTSLLSRPRSQKDVHLSSIPSLFPSWILQVLTEYRHTNTTYLFFLKSLNSVILWLIREITFWATYAKSLYISPNEFCSECLGIQHTGHDQVPFLVASDFPFQCFPFSHYREKKKESTHL